MTEHNIQTNKKAAMAWTLAVIAGVMFGFGFALSPLYDLFCDITGINGKGYTIGDELAPQPWQVTTDNRQLEIILVTQYGNNIGANVDFTSQLNSQTIVFNQSYIAKFDLKNNTDKPIVVRAIPSVSPSLASKSVHKIECFCMQEQPLLPGETRTVTMNYWFDPIDDESITKVIMGYTLYDITENASADVFKKHQLLAK